MCIMIFLTLGLQLAVIGTLQEVQFVRRPDRDVTFYVIPDNFTPRNNTQPPLECEGESIVANPVFVPEGTSIRPACTNKQTLKRISPKNNATADPLSAALSTIDSLSTPCSVLVFASDVDIEGPLDIICDSDPQGYLSSTVMVWVEKDTSRIRIHNVRAHVYIGSDTPLNIHNMSLTEMKDQSKVFVDGVNARNQVIEGSVSTTHFHPELTNGPFALVKIFSDVGRDHSHTIAFKVLFGIAMIVIICLLVLVVHEEKTSNKEA